ncbi:hypothetical protein Ahy_A07g031864 [Arachis hypogaea]|uniref:Uncharacterized protein n=1 Tax=Arachis hypogaea TaxID=3818 RepID=A0A445C590_ARAHY|nr:hypothetical protein Ahy_A07g031864 [Arachis hypogaea]
MIHISGSAADEHIELSMWLRALTVQAQRRRFALRISVDSVIIPLALHPVRIRSSVSV